MVRDIAATLVEYQSGMAPLLLRSAETTGGVGDWIYWMMGYARLNGMEKEGVSGFIHPYPASHSIRYHGRHCFHLFPIMSKHVLHLSSKFLELIRFGVFIILVDPS